MQAFLPGTNLLLSFALFILGHHLVFLAVGFLSRMLESFSSLVSAGVTPIISSKESWAPVLFSSRGLYNFSCYTTLGVAVPRVTTNMRGSCLSGFVMFFM